MVRVCHPEPATPSPWSSSPLSLFYYNASYLHRILVKKAPVYFLEPDIINPILQMKKLRIISKDM